MSDLELKRFRIPDRDVKMTKDEVAVTCTSTFQRLFLLKQLGLAYLVYPCATHTRGGHSIECLDEATRMLDALMDVGKWSDDYLTVRMAALLHDIGHVPFSHTLEDENVVLITKHDKSERLQRVLSRLKEDIPGNARDVVDRATPIIQAISGNVEACFDWRSDLVGNTVCADLLAYIRTDAAWTGIEKRPGYYRIYDYLKRQEKETANEGERKLRLCVQLTKGGLRTDVVSAILDLLDMRYALYERVTFHHAKAVASAMLARAARLAGLKDDSLLLDMGDEGFLAFLQAKATEKRGPDGEGALFLLRHLRSRQLFKRVYKVQRERREEWERTNGEGSFSSKWRDADSVEGLARSVEDQYSLPRGSLAVWCPEGKSGMKLVRANVTWEQANGWHDPVELNSKAVQKQFPGVYGRVRTIEEQYLDLWTFWVAISPEALSEAPGVMDAIEDRIGIECDPAFAKTYLRKRSGPFSESAGIYDEAESTWRKKFKPAVGRLIRDELAARGEKTVDDTVVTHAIRSVAEQKTTPEKHDRKKSAESGQAKLPISGEEK